MIEQGPQGHLKLSSLKSPALSLLQPSEMASLLNPKRSTINSDLVEKAEGDVVCERVI